MVCSWPEADVKTADSDLPSGTAVVTFGVSMLATAAARRIFRKKDPCGATLAEAEKRHAEKGNSAKVSARDHILYLRLAYR